MKKNKLLKSILLIISLLIPSLTMADDICVEPSGCEKRVSTARSGSCSLKEGTSISITNYIQNTRKIVKNVVTEITKAKVDEKTGLENDYVKVNGYIESKKRLQQLSATFLRLWNTLSDWDGYNSYFDFYVTLPITQEVPVEIRRDHNILQNESKSINKLLTTIINRGSKEVQIKEPCKGVENCNLNSGTAAEIFLQLLKNHNRVETYYRLSTLGDTKDFSDNILFVPSSFKNNIKNEYSPDVLTACSMEDGFFAQIGAKIKEISNWQTLGVDGIKSWKEAWQMMQNIYNGTTDANLEKKLLKKELGRQGFSTSATNKILGNLDKYNSSDSGNTLTNMIASVANKFEAGLLETVDTFSDAIDSISDDFNETIDKNEKDRQNRTNSLTITEFKSIESKIIASKKINEEINYLFSSEIPFAQKQDINTAKLQGRLINMHISLLSSIKSLEDIITTSEKVCNKQGQGLGKCRH